MTTLYFNVKGGIQTGTVIIDAASANVTGVGNAALGNLVTANYFSGNGSLLTGINASNIASGTIPSSILGNSTVYVGTTSVALNRSSGSQSLTGITSIDGYAATVSANAQPNITSVGILSSGLVVGNISANATFGNGTLTTTGNITAPFFIGNVVGNISGTITVPGNDKSVLFNQMGNAQASDNLTFNYNSNVLTVVGNLTSSNADLGNLATANYVAGTLTTGAQPNITTVGALTDATVNGNLLVGGNLTVNGTTVYTNVNNLYVKDPIIEMGGSANAGPLVSNDGKDRGTLLHYYTTAPIDAFMGWDNSAGEFGFGSNVSVSGEIVTWNNYGNVHAGYFIGNGSALTGVSASSATTAGTVTTNAQPNITSTGTLNSVTATGTVNFIGASNVSLGPVGNVHITGGTSGYLLTTDGSGTLSWIAPPSTTSITNGTSNVSIASSDGNATIGIGGTNKVVEVATTGVYVTGLLTTGAGNITSGNASLGNLATASYFSGSGALLTNLNASNIASGTIPSSVLGNSTFYVGTTSIAANRASASQSLTGITSIDGYAATVSTAAQPNITSVGTLVSANITGNTITGNISVNGGLLSNRANVTVTTNTVIDEFAPATYRTAKYVVSASGTNGYQSAEIILVHNGTSSYISIYGSVCSNATADIVDFSSNVNGISGNVTVYATASGASTKVNLVATYLQT